MATGQDETIAERGKPSQRSFLNTFMHWASLEYEYFIAGVLVSALVVMLFANVIARYFFSYSIAVVEDLSRFSFVWVVYIGAVVAARYGIHFRVRVQLLLLPEGMRKYMLLFADVIWFGLCILVVYYGVQVIADMFQYPMISATLKINVAYAWTIIPIAFSIMAIRLAYRRYYELRQERNKEKDVIAQE